MSRVLGVVDLGVGNIFSLCAAFDFLGVDYIVSSRPDEIADATHIILPGVGAFDAAMEKLREGELGSLLYDQIVGRKKPVLGICLGMQLLFEGSEEGRLDGLAIVPGRLKRLAACGGAGFKVPHVGFAEVYGFEETGLFAGLGTSPCFYFTHSYAADRAGASFNCASSNHSYAFIAGFQRGNVCGVQFHPEKSQSSGLKLLSNFIELVPG